MPSLLTLPGELIQEIILHVIHPGATPAHSPPLSNSDWIACTFYCSGAEPPLIYHLPGLHLRKQKPLSALSLTCRALNAHTVEVMRSYGAQAPCTLDVAVKSDGDCYATWTMIPQNVLDKKDVGGWHLDRLDINIRLLHEDSCTEFEKAGYFVNKLIQDMIRHGPGHQLSVVPLPMRTRRTKRPLVSFIDTIRMTYMPCFGDPSMSSTQKVEVLRLLARSVQHSVPVGDIFVSDRTTKLLGPIEDLECVMVKKYEVCLEEELQVSFGYRGMDESEPDEPPGGSEVFGAGAPATGGLVSFRGVPYSRRWVLNAVVHNNAETLKAVTRV